MAFFICWATKPLLWLIPAFFFLGMAGNRGDALQRQRGAERQRLFLLILPATTFVFGTLQAAIARREIMDFVRWKRALLRGLMLLGLGLHTASCFIALDSVADMLLGDSSAAVSSACAVAVVAAHLRLVWVAVFEA